MSESSREGRYDGTEVAICGLAGRWPGAPDGESLWRNLRDGVESITRFSTEELRDAGEEPEKLEDPRYVPVRPVLEGVEGFDAAFFGLAPREAEIIDPQHRVFLEVAWQAMEDAGYDSTRFAGAVSLFAGATFSSYLVHNLYKNRPVMESYGDMLSTIQNVPDSMVTMAAYKLGLRGACCAVQTFCSSSLVSVHLACQSLLNYESDIALAGGVSIYVPQTSGYVHEEGSILSREGRCRAFDAGADGTVFGNGAAVVVLRRLADALKDGDDVRAVLRGSAINNDGPVKASFAAPAVLGQSEVVVEALAAADVSPDTISLVEAHGTGTPLGDPAEVRALTQAFRAGTSRRGYCALGSIKTNVGHLDAAAGVTGLIKVVLSLQNGQIPPSLHFETPNPDIDFESTPFFVNTTLREWPRGEEPRRAGVSAFGVGGTNAHVVVEEAPEPAAPASRRPDQLLVLSARTDVALDRSKAALAKHLAERPDLPLEDVAWTLQVGRRAFDRRWAAVCRGTKEAVNVLQDATTSSAVPAVEQLNPPVTLVFPSASPAFDAVTELSSREPRLREAIARGVALAGPRAGDLALLLEGAGPAGDGPLAIAAQVVVQHAVASTILSWGLEPAALIFEGAGEHAARILAGVSDLARELGGVLGPGGSDALPAGEPRVPLAPRGSRGRPPSGPAVEISANPPAGGLLAIQRTLWMAGVELDWSATHGTASPQRVALPTYPFDRERFWVDPLPEETGKVVEPGPAEWMYRVSWTSAVHPAPTGTMTHLVFSVPGDLGGGLVETLRDEGDEVVTVEPGSEFSGDPGTGYRLDPANADHYSRLWADLASRGCRPRSVVHTWVATAPASETDLHESFEDASRLGFHSVRHLMAAAPRDEGELWLRVVADGLHAGLDDTALRPEVAPLVGLLRVLPQEHEGLRCVACDVAWPSMSGRIIEALAHEVRSSRSDPVVALRPGGRFVQSFEALGDGDDWHGPAPRREGVYLVVGGLGHVGFAHAVALARRAPARLVLTARSPLPPRDEWGAWLESHDATEATALRIRRVQALEGLGARVLTAAVDVADEDSIARLLSRIDEHFGDLHGVVYAAGELASETFEPVRDLSSRACDRQFGPKVHGLLNLDRLLGPRALDFVVLTSSLSTVLGGYGYGGYAGANAFLDAFAARRSETGRTPWFSVDWDQWMIPGQRSREHDAPALAPWQGLEVVERLFDLVNLRRLVVSVSPLEARLRRWVTFEESVGGLANEPGIAVSSNEMSPPGASIEAALREHGAIEAVAVVPTDRRGDSFTAYVCFGNGQEPTMTELRSWLRPRLPEGSQAPAVVVLDALPLSPDGSVDRRRLASIDAGGSEGPAGDDEPRTETERLVAGIWQETLGRPHVTVRDNFFDLGGHSLLSVRVVTRIEKELGVRLDPRDLIFQTLEQVAAACESRAEAVVRQA